MLKSMNDPNDQCEWLETKKQEMLRWDDEFIEQAAEEYADHCVAHWDKKAPSLDLTIEDTFKSLDNLGDLVQRYYGLFFASNLKLEPIPQSPIFDIFQEPWLVPLSSPDSETG